jgi:hypothetical protein
LQRCGVPFRFGWIECLSIMAFPVSPGLGFWRESAARRLAPGARRGSAQIRIMLWSNAVHSGKMGAGKI